MAALLLGLQGGAEALSSRHYDLRTTCTREQGQELLDFMELVHQTYTALLKPEHPRDLEGKRFTILLYRDMDEYVRAGAPPGSGAYYDSVKKVLVGWYDTMFMKPFFAHEGMHQFTDVTSRNFRDFPMWFTEGVADCIGNGEVRGKKLYMCVKSGTISRMRLQLAQAAIRAGVLPLERLLALPKDVFMRNGDVCYALSWSFCHFLMAYPKEEDRSVQIPDGRYRKHLAGYYERMRAGGVRHEQAWEEAFKGIPMARLEAEWRKYVLDLDAGRYLGITGGRELSDEESAAGKLGAGYTGILIEGVSPEGAAAKGGMKPGDILIRFDGKRLPRHDALNRIRVWIQDVPAGRPVKATVLREGGEVDCPVKW
jgi:hypothetical protein